VKSEAERAALIEENRRLDRILRSMRRDERNPSRVLVEVDGAEVFIGEAPFETRGHDTLTESADVLPLDQRGAAEPFSAADELNEKERAATVEECNKRLNGIMATMKREKKRPAVFVTDGDKAFFIGKVPPDGWLAAHRKGVKYIAPGLRLDRRGAAELFNAVFQLAGLRTVAGELPPGRPLMAGLPDYLAPFDSSLVQRGMSEELVTILNVWRYFHKRPRGDERTDLKARLERRLHLLRDLVRLDADDPRPCSQEYFSALQAMKHALPHEESTFRIWTRPYSDLGGSDQVCRKPKPGSSLAFLLSWLRCFLIERGVTYGLGTWGAALFVASIGEAADKTAEELRKAAENASRAK